MSICCAAAFFLRPTPPATAIRGTVRVEGMGPVSGTIAYERRSDGRPERHTAKIYEGQFKFERPLPAGTYRVEIGSQDDLFPKHVFTKHEVPEHDNEYDTCFVLTSEPPSDLLLNGAVVIKPGHSRRGAPE